MHGITSFVEAVYRKKLADLLPYIPLPDAKNKLKIGQLDKPHAEATPRELNSLIQTILIDKNAACVGYTIEDYTPALYFSWAGSIARTSFELSGGEAQLISVTYIPPDKKEGILDSVRPCPQFDAAGNVSPDISKLLIRPNKPSQPLPVQPNESETKQARPPRKIVTVFEGLGSSVHNGQSDGDLANKVIDRLVSERGFSPSDIWAASLGGWRITENGFYLPKDQECDETLRDSKTNGAYVAELLKGIQKQNKNNEIVAFTHSLGAIRFLAGLEELLNDPDFDFTKLTGVITNGPNYGVSKPLLEYIFAWGKQDLPKGCNLNLLLFNTPSPDVSNYPAMVELLSWWDNYDDRDKYLQDLMNRVNKRGAKIIAVGSYNDGVMDASTFMLNRLEIEARLQIASIARKTMPSLTQTLPSPAITVMRYMGQGPTDLFGHRRLWDTNEGTNILTALVGDQYPKEVLAEK
jgi:hypothetical protein